jgi:hypothetical protein
MSIAAVPASTWRSPAQRDAVDRVPRDTDHGSERPFPTIHPYELAADHHDTEGDARDEQPAQTDGAGMKVGCRVPDHDEG